MSNSASKLNLTRETICSLSDEEMQSVEGATDIWVVGGVLLYVGYDIGTRLGAKMKQATW